MRNSAPFRRRPDCRNALALPPLRRSRTCRAGASNRRSRSRCLRPSRERRPPRSRREPPPQAQNRRATAAAGAAARHRAARALHGARRSRRRCPHRREPRGVPQGPGRHRAKKDRAALAKLVLRAGLLLVEGRGQRGRQEDRHRGARDRARPRRQGWLGLEIARRFAEDDTAAGLSGPSEHGVLAGRTRVQAKELEKLAETTKTDIGDWGFTVDGRRRGARRRAGNSPVIEKLGLIFVRVMPDTAPNASQDFMRVVTPSGKVGSWRRKRSTRSAPTSSATARTPPAPGRSSA